MSTNPPSQGNEGSQAPAQNLNYTVGQNHGVNLGGEDIAMSSSAQANPSARQPSSETYMETFESHGDIPQARFGHTITVVHKTKVVLFGGAMGDTGRYQMTGETFLYNILTKTWKKLDIKGVPPSPRAAHSSTNVEQMQMVVYGGASGGGSLASDDLYLLDMRNGEEVAQWMIVPVVGATPGRRYGHSIIFLKP
jgi:protein phosphatase